MLFDPLWVPLLSHYAGDGSLDAPRCRSHIGSLYPLVRQYLVGGTTGDGWGMSDRVLGQWLGLCSDSLERDQALLVGAFAETTEGVVERARRIEAHFRERPTRARFLGLTLCAQVDEAASQPAILDHFRAALAATSLPVAIYQLPQITGCEIAPETFAQIAEDSRVVLFKDTSGGDSIALSGGPFGGARLLRGAEGRYGEQLKPSGPYDGWLLSTANVFGAELREIADYVADGAVEQAAALSDRLSAVVSALFAEAQSLGNNAFADVSRGGDHIRANGRDWASQPPPRRADGSELPRGFLASVEAEISRGGFGTALGYLANRS